MGNLLMISYTSLILAFPCENCSVSFFSVSVLVAPAICLYSHPDIGIFTVTSFVLIKEENKKARRLAGLQGHTFKMSGYL